MEVIRGLLDKTTQREKNSHELIGNRTTKQQLKEEDTLSF